MSDISLIPSHLPPAAGRPTEPEHNPAQNFRLGQILTAKVLRVYENGSYQVEMNGAQHVVDSAIPLRQGEVFKGKVVGLGERAILEKIVDASTKVQADVPVLPDWLDRNAAQDLQAFVIRHLSIFDARTWNTLIRTANQAKSPLAVLSAAVFLNKLGVPVNAAFAAELAHYATGERRVAPPVKREALYLETASIADVATQSSNAIPLIANFLKQKADSITDELRDAAAEAKDASQPDKRDGKEAVKPVGGQQGQAAQQTLDQTVLQWLMNAQLGGAVTHRLLVVPFVINGQLVELEMAVFDQHENADAPSQLKSKVIHLSLDMDHLGRLDVAIQSVNQNLKVHFLSESEQGLQVLTTHRQELMSQLAILDYRVDELRYDPLPATAAHGAVMPVMNFVVNADSLSVLA